MPNDMFIYALAARLLAVFELLAVQEKCLRCLSCEKVIPEPNETINILSEKQRIVFKHILHGLNAKEIAKKMNLSFRTIEFHTDKIKEAFNASSKSELVSIAIKKNLMGIFF